jgi:hypothetical protein
MKRRTFIKRAAGATAAASAGVFAILRFPRGANAAGWGAWPEDKLDAFLAPEQQARSVLELHVNGGMSAFDTFYTVPSWGEPPAYRFLYCMDEGAPWVGPDPSNNIQGRWLDCTGGSGNLSVPFEAQDANGVGIHLGPWTYPFRNRPDVLNRMRIVVTAHDQAAHEGANPVSFTGLRLGNPRMAGLGTAIQRYFAENPEAPGGGGIRPAPYSYVLYPEGYKPFNAVAASSVGAHPGSARPLVVSVEPNSELSQLLARSALDRPQAFDRAVAYYRAEYESRLRAFGHSTPARSAERANYEFATFAREHATELTNILSGDLFAPVAPPAAVCNDPQNGDDMPRMQARMAASLLTRNDNAARYVLWIDAGLDPAITGGHDTHNYSVNLNGINYPHTFQALLDVIATPEQAGMPGLINLDETMVIINTEFGRTPEPQGSPGAPTLGTNHHPEGYVQVFIGGPVQGRSVYGAIREGDGSADGVFARPAQSRMMALQAMGIYPFSTQSYNVAEGGASDELEAAQRINQLLGVEV